MSDLDDNKLDSIKIHLLSLQHCFFFLLLRNLLMNVGIIQPVQIRILADLIIKGNYYRTTLISPIPEAVLVTNRSCASDTPITSAIFELSV